MEAAFALGLALAASGCQEQSSQSLAAVNIQAGESRIAGAVKPRDMDVRAVADHVDDYIGDRFSDVEKALASKPTPQEPEPDAPTF